MPFSQAPASLMRLHALILFSSAAYTMTTHPRHILTLVHHPPTLRSFNSTRALLNWMTPSPAIVASVMHLLRAISGAPPWRSRITFSSSAPISPLSVMEP